MRQSWSRESADKPTDKLKRTAAATGRLPPIQTAPNPGSMLADLAPAAPPPRSSGGVGHAGSRGGSDSVLCGRGAEEWPSPIVPPPTGIRGGSRPLGVAGVARRRTAASANGERLDPIRRPGGNQVPCAGSLGPPGFGLGAAPPLSRPRGSSATPPLPPSSRGDGGLGGNVALGGIGGESGGNTKVADGSAPAPPRGSSRRPRGTTVADEASAARTPSAASPAPRYPGRGTGYDASRMSPSRVSGRTPWSHLGGLGGAAAVPTKASPAGSAASSPTGAALAGGGRGASAALPAAAAAPPPPAAPAAAAPAGSVAQGASDKEQAPEDSAAVSERAAKNAARCQAVASLQRLFFEEVERGGDPNAAAAKALLRLAEESRPVDTCSPRR